MNASQYIPQRLDTPARSTLDLEHVLDGMSDACLVLDKEWRICFVNREAARINGKAPEEFLGKTHWDEWPSSVGTPVEAAYRKAMTEQVAVHLEHHYQDATHDVWLEINAYPTADTLAIFYRDIGERKRAEEALQHSEARFRAAALAVGDIVWTNSPTGQMEGEQVGWGAFTGQTSAEYRGYGWANAVHPDDAQPTLDAWNEAVAERKTFVFEHRLRRADGEWRQFAIRAVPVLNADGRIREWVGVHTDITEQRQTQHEIEDLNQRLRRAMTETHHRVKNNLQVMLAMIEMQVLEHQVDQRVPLKEFARLQAHVHTLSIVHDLLTLNIKEEEEAQRISVNAVLERLLPMLQRTMWKQTVRYTAQDVEVTSRHCIAMALVLNELVTNALKYGKQEAEVKFAVEGTNAVLTVCDDGAGFPEGFVPERAANIGLELVRSLVRIDLGGVVVYDNHAQGGGRVTVTFPLLEEEKLESASGGRA